MDIYTGNLPKGFRYVPQDNYLFYNPKAVKLSYLYSDSATSCIILIVVGKNHDDEEMVAITHLSRRVRFEAFFELVERKFSGGVSVYAQGANPPFPVEKDGSFSYDAVSNSETLFKWIISKLFVPKCELGSDWPQFDNRVSCIKVETLKGIEKPAFYIQQCTVTVGSGDPNTGFGGYGINVDVKNKDYLVASNKYFCIEPTDRDPDGGLQTLFCVFGLRTGLSSLVLRNVDENFSEQEKDTLVSIAEKNDWLKILDYTPDEILDKYSSTPEFEPRWFCDTLIESAKFVKNYKNNQRGI